MKLTRHYTLPERLPFDMKLDFNRREFIRTTTVAAFAAVTVPSVLAKTEAVSTVALVGCAHIHTPNYVELLKGRKDVRVKLVWDYNDGRARENANALSTQVAKDLGEVWNDKEITAVVICSETNRHHDLILAAAQAGKHIFAEKPMGITGRESREMADAIQKANLLFTTGYFMRTDPAHLFLRQEIAKGHFGAITRVRGSNCHAGSFKGYFDGPYRWMADPAIAGVGAYGDLGTHKLDILMWLIGDVDSVTAEVKSVTGKYPGCDECGEGIIRFKNGAIGTLGAGWVDVQDPVQLLISGTEAHAAVVNGKLYYKNDKVRGANGTSPFRSLPKKLAEPLDQFLNAVGGKKGEPLVTPREAAARVTVMEAMYQSARARSWVSL